MERKKCRPSTGFDVSLTIGFAQIARYPDALFHDLAEGMQAIFHCGVELVRHLACSSTRNRLQQLE